MIRKITLRVRRGQAWANYEVEVSEDAYLLDALQAAQLQDSSLVFRHACHHGSCGSCGMRINGREKLACTTPIAQVAGRRGRITLEPMRNFPVIADLAVDPSGLFEKMEQVGLSLLRPDEAEREFSPLDGPVPRQFLRFENCIECGLCISACPIATTDSAYHGPAPLAGAFRAAVKTAAGMSPETHELIDSAQGLWRCHSAFECTDVCPANVDPAQAIMQLRRRIIFRQGT